MSNHDSRAIDENLFALDPAREITRLILVSYGKSYDLTRDPMGKDVILTLAARDARGLLHRMLAEHWSI